MSGKPHFSVLGPLEVTRSGRPVRVGPPRLRALLATLLLRANRPVPTSDLVDRLWNDHPPDQPRDAVQLYVVRLRKALGDPRLIETGSGGYRIQVDAHHLDLLRFEHLLLEAERARDVTRRAELTDQALRLWRDPVCCDVDSDVLQTLDATPWNERRLEAEERLVEDELSLGHHASQISRLRRLVAEHPLRERFWVQLVVALHRSGRQAEALHVYRSAVAVLAEELGVRPGRELREAHATVLAAEARLVPPADAAAPRPAEQASSVRPAQLPADTASFSGRAREIDQLLVLPRLADRSPTAVPIGRIEGMAGVGKTALAVHVAHRLAPGFPDGQLFVDLHGYTAGRTPMAPGAALERMLRALGVDDDSLPSELEERSALLRSVLADRRMIVVLDNVRYDDQVRPLLPGSPGCLVLVTSRQRLKTIDAARHVSLDVLPAPEAVAMFERSYGGTRPLGESRGPTGDLVDLCGRLPLAIRHAAELLRSRPAWTARDLVDQLRDRCSSSQGLSDGTGGVGAALELSYRSLTAEQQRAFRLFGLHAGTELTPDAAAALVGTTKERATQLLDELADAHLLEERVRGRYRFHGLVKAFARTQLTTAEDKQAAVERLLDHYYGSTTGVARIHYYALVTAELEQRSRAC